MAKIKKKIFCENCDSEYEIKYEIGSIANIEQLYCICCKEELDLEEDEDN